MSNELRDTMASVTGNFAAHDDESLRAMIARMADESGNPGFIVPVRQHLQFWSIDLRSFHARAMKVVEEMPHNGPYVYTGEALNVHEHEGKCFRCRLLALFGKVAL